MKKLFLAVVLGLLQASTASADPHFCNATPDAFKVLATLPNGAKDSRDLRTGSSNLTSESFTLAAGVKQIQVTILDDMDKPVWKGDAKADGTYLVVSSDKGPKVIYAGYYGSNDSPRAVVLMNATGEPLTIDLEGNNGVAASRGIVPGTSFDIKQAVKLDPRESTYSVKAKHKDGSPIEIDGTVGPGRYLLIWKNASGDYHATTLGTIKP